MNSQPFENLIEPAGRNIKTDKIINPAKYIQKQILDDKFDLNDFRTAKIQTE